MSKLAGCITQYNLTPWFDDPHKKYLDNVATEYRKAL